MDLMKARVEHDKKFGFRFTSATNVPRAISILSGVLGEAVEMSRTCFICEDALDDTPLNSNSPGLERTLCQSCSENEDAYSFYMMKFAKLMETA